MHNKIKTVIKDYKLKKAKLRYDKEVQYLKDPYASFIKQEELGLKSTNRVFECEKFTLREFVEILKKGEFSVQYSFLCVQLLEGECDLPYTYLHQNITDEVGLVYCDEDMSVDGKRYGAWFKPDYSPDTLLSFFYFGSMLLIKVEMLREALNSYTLDTQVKQPMDRQILYDFILYYTNYLMKQHKVIKHIPKVLFHAKGEKVEPENTQLPEVVNEAAYFGYEPEYDWCKIRAGKALGLKLKMRQSKRNGRIYSIPVYTISKEPKVSIIIPSKDNVEVLSACIYSVNKITNYRNYEIIVVDNGSKEENRLKVLLLQQSYSFQYIYKPMEFNYSKMCNIGVDHATGEYILLLNDDMEIIQSDWLTTLVSQAMLPNVGAVGAKLLYPDTDLIQHVGITNLLIGPGHKLLKEHDQDVDYYYGRNVLVYNMIGVTAACLLVKKDKYREVGSFCEEIAVSYNDVDFNFSLHEAGYRNIIRNDVVLYHHESLSRGDDNLSDQKWERLLLEKETVYQRHPALRYKDPYYSINATGFKHKYFCDYLYPYEQRKLYQSLELFTGHLLEQWNNNCLTVTLEHVKLERKIELLEEKDIYWIEGWSYVLGMDNSRYEKKIILENENGQRYAVTPYVRYRQDVVEILPEQQNVELSGFVCRIPKEELKCSEYKIFVLYKDKCSRQYLYKECEERLKIEQTER